MALSDAIDTDKPVQGNPTTASVRENFSAVKSALAQLELTAGIGPRGFSIHSYGAAAPMANISAIPGMVIGDYAVNASTSPVTMLGVANVAIGGIVMSTSATTGTASGNIRGLPGTAGSVATIVVGTVTTGAPGTNAQVTNAGTAQAASLNFVIPRGDAGTGGAGITETQAVDAVKRSAPNFTEIPVTVVEAQSTANISTTAPIRGDGWTGGATATAAVTKAIYTGEPLSYPINITAGDVLTISFSTTGTPDEWDGRWEMYLASQAGGTDQWVAGPGRMNETLSVWATANYTHLVINPAWNWAGNFTLTFVRRYSTARNSTSLWFKDLPIVVKGTSLFIGGGRLAITGTSNLGMGVEALRDLTSGNDNAAVGRAALRGNMTGHNNVAVGPFASNQLRTAQNTTAVGGNCLRNGRSSWNTAFGYNCLGELTTGGINIGLGPNCAGYNYDGHAATGMNDGVYIGCDCYVGDINAYNEIVIGRNAVGHGSYTISLGNEDITSLHCNVTSISTISDPRVKDNIQAADLNKCLDAVKNLPVSRWGWRPIAGRRRDRHVTGFLSDDIVKVFPKAVVLGVEALSKRDADGNVIKKTVKRGVITKHDEHDQAHIPPLEGEESYDWEVPDREIFRDFKRVELTEALPTLWGAVQKLIQRIEALETKK